MRVQSSLALYGKLVLRDLGELGRPPIPLAACCWASSEAKTNAALLTGRSPNIIKVISHSNIKVFYRLVAKKPVASHWGFPVRRAGNQGSYSTAASG